MFCGRKEFTKRFTGMKWKKIMTEFSITGKKFQQIYTNIEPTLVESSYTLAWIHPSMASNPSLTSFSSWLRKKIHFSPPPQPPPLAGVQDLLCLHTHNFEFKTDDERSNTSLMFNHSLNFKYKVTAGGRQCLRCFKSTPIYIHLGFTGFASVWWNSWSGIWFTASATTELSQTSGYLQILFSDKLPCNILYHNIKLQKTW